MRDNKAFTLIELLVVVAIIGILAAVGVVAYNGYVESARKAVAKQNFKNTVRYFANEVAKCDMDSSQKAFNLSCPVQVNSNYQTCAAIYLSWQYNIRNPKFPKEATGWTADASGGGCRTVVTGSDRGGVRSGDGQVDGDVNIVVCPRSPYCGNEASGKFKIMWWWDNKTMQDFQVVDGNL